jgi:ribosomal protein L37AE/L43A
MRSITGTCPRCLVTTGHKLIGAGIYQCHCCGHTHDIAEIRVYNKPPKDSPGQKGLFD